MIEIQEKQPPQEIVAYAPDHSLLCTEPLFRFLKEYHEILTLIIFVVQMADSLDKVTVSFNKMSAILGGNGKPPLTETAGFHGVRHYSRQLSRHLVTQMVNNLLCYLSEILQVAIVKRPEILRSSEQISINEVLQFTRMNDVVSYLTDRKINELSYGGLKQINEFISKRLGLELFDTDPQRLRLTLFIELRNIHTHNRGIINQLFLDRVGKDQEVKRQLGELYHVDLDEFILLSNNAIEIATKLDSDIARKFGVKRKRHLKSGQRQKLLGPSPSAACS